MTEKRLAIVTGGARGIGFAIGRRLGQDGYKVVLLDVLEAQLSESSEKLRAEGLEVLPLAVDLADAASVGTISDRLGEDLRRVAILINNAGISPKRDGRKVPLDSLPLAQWETVLRVNLTAPFLLAQLVIPPMRANRYGRIVNVSSRAARMPSGVAGADYIASKSGLVGLTKAIAQDYAADGITANAIAPGSVQGPMANSNSPEAQREIMAKIPVGRLSTPEEVANAVAFLASPGAGYITGATLDVNGGVVMI